MEVCDEMQYITYKNKLKYLMEIEEIKYYNELMHLNKNCSIKCVINKKKPSSGSSNYLIDGKLTNDKNLIADKFNEYFTNIGINLSKIFQIYLIVLNSLWKGIMSNVWYLKK